MLIYFKVGNYKSIKEPIVINFAATAITEHQETNVLEKGKEKLLKSILLYGPNAGGKSKILDAFLLYRQLITRSAMRNSTASMPVQPFLLNDKTSLEPSHFEAEFILDGKRYRYGFEAFPKQVNSEWLLEVKTTKVSNIYMRIGQNFDIDYKKFVNAEGLDSKCGENALFLSVADQWNVKLAKEIYQWFDSIQNMHGLEDNAMKIWTNELFETDEYRDLINQMMKHADLGIKCMNIEKDKDDEPKLLIRINGVDINNEASRPRGQVTARHDVFNDSGDIVGETTFNMERYESEGTRKFYSMLGAILYAIKNGRLVVIDEIDARFHTLLTKAIVKLFNSENVKTGAQLLAVCHDVAVMDNDLLRRDQIYIVEKDNFAATKVVNLVEYKSARKETPLAKNYLDGKYGGIPFIENLENFLTNDAK